MPKLRVYELAKELGTDSKTVMSALQDLGCFVRSASSPVEPATVRALRNCFPAERTPDSRRTHVGPSPVCEAQPSRSPRDRPERPGAVFRRETASWAAPGSPNRGRNPFSLPRGESSQRPRPRKRIADQQRAELDAIFGAAIVDWVLSGAQDAGYDFEWRSRIIDYETYQQFMAVGLAPRQAKLAHEILQAGLTPGELVIQLGELTVREWVFRGYSPERVATTLRECQADPKSRHLLGGAVAG